MAGGSIGLDEHGFCQEAAHILDPKAKIYGALDLWTPQRSLGTIMRP